MQVTVTGGVKTEEVVVTGDRLHDYDALVQIATEIALPPNIKESKDYLTKVVNRCDMYYY